MKPSRPSLAGSTRVLLAAMLMLLLNWALFHTPIQRTLASRLLLLVDSPTDDFFADVLKNRKDPVELLERCWATGKVRHRALVAAFLKDNALAHKPWLIRAEPLLRACASDADASVRELGLAALEAEHNPMLLSAAQAQLDDVDPMIRLLGIEYLRKCSPRRAVPILMRSLDERDLRIVTAAEVALMHISQKDFGVKAVQAVSSPGSSGQVTPGNLEAIRLGVERRKQWWQEHEREYDAISASPLGRAQITELKRPTSPDFSLKDLQGHSLRLSNFRGRVVVLNFWATWCTACAAEIPDLVSLQREMGNRAAVIGVALDGVPDEDGDIPGEPAEDNSHHNGPSLDAIRAKVERTVKARRITYPVSLDPKNSVGGQYNGGELPTTVIIDATGRVRRRFVGERNLEVFKAMVQELEEPKLATAGKP